MIVLICFLCLYLIGCVCALCSVHVALRYKKIKVTKELGHAVLKSSLYSWIAFLDVLFNGVEVEGF